MNRNKILTGLLIASWTLNVALGVALFLKSKYPQGSYLTGNFAAEAGLRRPDSFAPPNAMKHLKDKGIELREEIIPLKMERKRLLIDLTRAIVAEQLDSIRIRALSDTLDSLNGCIQQQQIRCMMQMHDQIPSYLRRELVPRMMRRMQGHPGPGHMRGHGKFHNKLRKKDQ